jgi:putative transposase
MKKTQVARLLVYVTGMVNQQVLLQNEYLIAENRILRIHLPTRLVLSDPERSTLAVLGKRLGRRGLEPLATAAKPDTILAWVSQAGRAEVRWLPATPLSRSTAHRT